MLNRLDRLTQEAVKMETVILEVAHLIRSVGAVGDNVNQFGEGTFDTLALLKYHLNPTND